MDFEFTADYRPFLQEYVTYHMKKLCFVVSSPATALAFLKGPMEVLAASYELHLIANTTHPQELLEELPIKAVHVFPIERGIRPLHDFRCLIQVIRFFSP